MRGFQFNLKSRYMDLINSLFEGIDLKSYDLYNCDNDIVLMNGGDLKLTNKLIDDEMFEELKRKAPYLVVFLHVCAYEKGAKSIKIKELSDYLNSQCQFVIFVVDADLVEVYAKNEALFLQFLKNAIKIKGTEIKIKTDYDDDRVRMSL